ncbi:MAG TPA: ATP synthase F1 subunit delta [Clostridia bacterium]|nr:ATP synthase F1 subunit delta [Clostridia bacterium]
MAAVASRYARAFADVVFEQKLNPVRTVQQFRAFVELFNSSEDLRKVWEAPAIPAEQKRNLLDSIVAQMGDMPRVFRNFIAVLIDHNRMSQLPIIARQFEAELNQRLGLVQAEIVSSRPLTSSEQLELTSQVAKITGRQVTAQYSINPALLGGAIVKIGSTVYDGSVRGQLQKIKQQLSE